MQREPSALNGLYLDDSYFLGLLVIGTTIRVRALFALTQDHEAYAPPRAGEQHCYREGEISFLEVEVTDWKAGRPSISIDPDGSLDLGGIRIDQRADSYRVSTDWFDMTCRSNGLSVALD